MIPKKITKQHIKDAIKEIDGGVIPSKRNSTKYNLIFNEKAYPPKYVISIANEVAFGKALAPSEFNGGKETNDFLTDLDFDIQIKNK